MDRSLVIAGHWSDDAFREPLTRLLDHPDPAVVVSAARALLRFGDRELRPRLDRMRSDPRRVGPEDLHSVGDMISRAIERDSTLQPGTVVTVPGLVEVAEDGLLEPWRWGFSDVPDAVARLGNGDVSIRLQAFVWLASVGVVIDSRVLSEAWPSLSDPVRQAVVRAMHTVHWGREKLAAPFLPILEGKLAGALSARTRARVLVLLGSIGAAGARDACLRIIREAECAGSDAQLADQDSDGFALASAGFEAFAGMTNDADAPRALEWAESEVRVVRYGGVFVLARLSDPNAVAQVKAYIGRGAERPFGVGILDPYDSLRMSNPRDEAIKRAYLQAILAALEEELSRVPSGQKWLSVGLASGSRAMYEHVRVLEAIACVCNGPSGFYAPAMSMNLELLRATTENWRKWMEDNDPGRRRSGR